MSFFGIEVKGGQPTEIDEPITNVLHLTHVAVADMNKKGRSMVQVLIGQSFCATQKSQSRSAVSKTTTTADDHPTTSRTRK